MSTETNTATIEPAIQSNHPGYSNVLLQFLLEKNYATQEQAEQLIAYSEEQNIDIPTAIRNSGIVGTGNDVIRYIAEANDFEYVDLDQIEFQRDAVATLEQKQAAGLVAMPYALEEGILKVAVPIDHIKSVQLRDDLRRLTRIGIISLSIASRSDILKAIDTQYRSDAELANLSANASDTTDTDEDLTNEIGEEIGEESDVVRFVDLVLRQAVKDRASDIHFDPQEKAMVIRYRLDGILQNVTEAPTFMIPEIVSRIKIMANLDISKTREPQDGRLSIPFGNNTTMDFRVATLPATHGEKIVMRILDNSAAQMKLADLGFSQENLDRFEVAARKPYGVLLVTGPTGSGKSTTLYSALNALNSPDVNIITAEDPVEYQLDGITQVPVHHTLTFERVLRTVLRADPDIILIGEVRDQETAEIAMKAGMTGHMVFSTLHTNDAASALTRLGDMGVQPFITASTVEAIVSQRLVRRLCAKCKRPGAPTQVELESVGYETNLERDGEPNWYEAVGCKACNQSGYKGRMAIHEVLIMSDTIEEAVIQGEKAYAINKLAMAEGMISLKEDGFRKASKGLTTLSEIMRVVN